jgi:hypothetical protein
VILTEPARAVLGAMERAKQLKELIPNSYILNQVFSIASIDVKAYIHWKGFGKVKYRTQFPNLEFTMKKAK